MPATLLGKIGSIGLGLSSGWIISSWEHLSTAQLTGAELNSLTEKVSIGGAFAVMLYFFLNRFVKGQDFLEQRLADNTKTVADLTHTNEELRRQVEELQHTLNTISKQLQVQNATHQHDTH